MLIYVAIHLTPVQNWIVRTVTGKLSKNLNTTVKIDHIDFTFFNKMELKGLLIEDRQKDTLLSAGSASVNITDWFFFKDKATLHYIGLEDASINLRRKDSVWNYKFLLDYFGGSNKNSSSGGGLQLDIKKLHLKNIRFNQYDGWVGQDMNVSLKELTVDADKIDFDKKTVNLSSINLDKLFFGLNDYTGYRTKLGISRKPSPPRDSTVPYRWNEDGWIVNVKELTLNDGSFGSERESDRPPYEAGHFDEDHILFGSITGNFKNLHFEKDTLTSDISFGTKERCGFEVKKLAAKFKFTPEIMEFNNLDLVTDKSRLRDYYSMRYEDFEDDMSSFLHKVTLEGHFKDSYVSSDDIAYFAPELKPWKRTFTLSGTAKGPIDNIVTKRTVIKSNTTTVDGDIALRGLPDIDNTFIDFRANKLQTTYTDLITFIPVLRNVQQPRLSSLGVINYSGNFTGFINDFVAYGTFNTALGSATGDINMKFPDIGPSVYVGKLSATRFQLGKFLNNAGLGAITFNGSIDGKGFSTGNMNTNFDGSIQQLEYAGYNYQNIAVKGDFEKRLFKGNMSINDPNLKLDTLEGTIDLNKKVPEFNFDAKLSNADFKALKLTKDEFTLAGNFNLNFTGDNIDNFLGIARINNAQLLHNNTPLSFDSLTLQSQIINGEKNLSLQSNEVDASVKGRFKIMELPDAFKIFLSHYYPTYIKTPSYFVEDQDFSFDIKTKDVSNYIQLIDTSLKGFDNSSVYGNLKLKENELNISAIIPSFSYTNKVFNNIQLDSKGNLDTLVTKINIQDVVLNDSLHLPATTATIASHNDLSEVNINTRASKTLSDASLNARVRTLTDGVNIQFAPSSFIINDKKWELENNGELSIRKSQISANDIKLVQGNQQITISTEPSDLYSSNDILIGLKTVSIDDLAPFVLKEPKLEGVITGHATISDLFGKPYIEYDAKAEQFRFEGDSIGIVSAKGSYEGASGIIKFNADADNTGYEFDINGNINLNDSTGMQTDIGFISKKFNLALLNKYLGSVFSDIKGTANTSDLRISSKGKHFFLTGSAVLEQGSLLVNYTQCRYNFKNESIIFNPNEIDFGSISLTDTLNNAATLTGKLYHNFFSDFSFDNINLTVNKPSDNVPGTGRLLVLNTTKKDNAQFYGKVIGDASLSLNGPVTNMIMDIKGSPSPTDSSHIYLSVGAGGVENGAIDYIDFIQFGTKMENEFTSGSSSNIVVNMDLTANPACKIDVILDEATKDIIKGEGSGNLKIKVGNIEPLSINGTYYIEQGEYTFNFQTFLKKKFTLSDGSITWTGDPYLANINILAEYLATNVDFSNISNNSVRKKDNINVIAHLTSTLKQPKINFEFRLPETSELKSDVIINKRLLEFESDENEMNKQVTSLLLFNTFINNEQGFLNAGSGYSVLSGTIGGVVSNALSSSFNKLLQKLLNDNTISSYVNLNSTLGLESQVASLQAAAKVGITKSFLDGRLVVSVGGNFDYSNTPYVTSKETNVLLTPDITVEWILTKDGRIRVVGFNQTNYDLNLLGQRNRTGVKLTYRKESDKLRIFKPKETKQNTTK